MAFTIEQAEAKRGRFGDYRYRIFEDGRLVAHYWDDYRGDEHGIEFLDGTSEGWPGGRMIEFIEGGGPQPLVLSSRAVEYLQKRLAKKACGRNIRST